ncbi:hypothetical protein RclHR1_02630006 [Rhizophagus clarus]|uniref:BACK domain-containing protein n=1 Tax=Rhizophagus clarus TaxID=94130 RepID=A0A2Z6RG12_9GLOM|nr:hypothetical protein RclHR1_02630006 [Rhizophagus clarus]
MDEIEVWKSLLRWCFTQQNPTKWSIEDVTKIKRLLHRFIPLIRFYDISSTDFFYKVYCHKEILPQDLIHNLLEFHIIPNMKSKTNVYRWIYIMVPANNASYYAICCFSDQGPSMGGLCCPDSNNWTYDASDTHYPNIGIPSNFAVENYEVF